MQRNDPAHGLREQVHRLVELHDHPVNEIVKTANARVTRDTGKTRPADRNTPRRMGEAFGHATPHVHVARRPRQEEQLARHSHTD